MNSRLLLLLAFMMCSHLSFSQNQAAIFKTKQLQNARLAKDELQNQLVHHDFSKLFTVTDNALVYGFIGTNYQRIKIKLISVTKNRLHPEQYDIYGKSMVKNNICDFKGTITITNIRRYKKTSVGIDDEYKNKGIIGQYSILGDYLFAENNTQAHSGRFQGSFQSNFYLTKNQRIHYDDLDMIADGFDNNLFVGTWTSYNKQITKICNWGDYRIPNSGDLDVGAGDFSPADKYLQYGWQSVRDAYNQEPLSQKAKKEENQVWW